MDSDGEQEPDGLRQADPNGEADLDERYPNRPRNHSPTLPFHDLFLTLFNPLNENKKRPTGPALARRKVGPHGHGAAVHLSPQERRRDIIQRFISRWKKEVGDDIFPAFRLIIPEKDRDRAMYGLKEKAIGKLLVKVMKIDKNSEDGFSLLNWKVPGQSFASRMAGDFAGRCFEVISKRPLRTEVGDMTIEEVNEQLDKLSAASKEDEQVPILAYFYRMMNPEELMWLIRIILRQMKVGATERTLFNIWHPDAEALFSISSSLRRVCWELYNPDIRLEGDEAKVTLMQCFQPQLAQFQMQSFERMIQKMRLAEDDPTFWIEEKLDGERMQLHMESDDSIPGGKRFVFWSRKAKEYTYLYGNGFFDENGALTRHLQKAFADGVQSIILDGEMITWDPEHDAIVPFGTLKSAALAEQRNPFSTGQRPLFRIFDILFLNGQPLTRYTLKDRRRALEASVIPVHRRFEIHTYEIGHSAADIEHLLRKVVAEASEGLVLKNPNSPYRLNERHDDWMKVKPEYMTEFGESLDCIVIGGYYGSGRRGGALSSFLCGLRVDESHAKKGDHPTKCYSFCKVGGGFTAADYANIRHHTDGKWIDWDPKRPPTEYIELAGGDLQYERPDVWIKPEDSVVLCVKASSVTPTDQFRLGLTVRFPRFKRLRMDKDWHSALSIQEFMDLKSNIEREVKEKEFKVDDSRKLRHRRTTKKPLTVAGYDGGKKTKYAGPSGKLFNGLNFFVMTESVHQPKKTKAQLEQLVKANGGKIYQTNTAAENTICIADRRTVKVASLQKNAKENVIRPSWLFDCLSQNERDHGLPDLLIPLEPKHMFFTTVDQEEEIAGNVDKYSDSYARDIDASELKKLLDAMAPAPGLPPSSISQLESQLESHSLNEQESPTATVSNNPLSPGWLFKGLVIYFATPPSKSNDEKGKKPHILAQRLQLASNLVEFAGGEAITDDSDMKDPRITHIVVDSKSSGDKAGMLVTNVAEIRRAISSLAGVGKQIPHIVGVEWVEESWRERTLVDEERYVPR
ncbi:DNA ligase 4, variant [Blastomyces gilchristii SLH14081]|uniref:DNA ligase n=1 Tax=Blastomyces gilchristii (strain SLH14081) TaxID=559298 RepID=A0A179UWL9_BLAGS|nr:DNA ligase 4, variant [Blastomyces gilchristii SLH14081]OAT12454.1 DNA ligase 4, variant [Blastomyces gilchristii SLH14081]